MKKMWKAGLLVLILAVPVFLYLFLQGFGTNEYDVPVINKNGIGENCPDNKDPSKVDDFSFIDYSTGDSISSQAFEKKITVLHFIPISCRDSCLRTMESLQRVAKTFSGEKIQIFSIAALPKDSLSKLKNFQEQFNADFSYWHWWYGSKNDLYEFQKCEIGYDKSEIPRLNQLVLVDELARVRGFYPGFSREEVDRFILEIRILLKSN